MSPYGFPWTYDDSTKVFKKVVIKLRNANNVNNMSLSAHFKLNKDNLNKTNFNKGFLIIGGL